MNNTALLQIRKLQIGENKYCFECKSGSPTWASLPYGIYLCYNCSGLHRAMGVHLTFVRSIEMDAWTDKQLAMMYQGGNPKLRTFFESHDIQISDPNKWKTNAAYYYREKMKALVNDSPPPQEPENWTDLYDAPKPSQQFQQQQTIQNTQQQQNANFWEQAQKSTKEAITKIDEKISKMQIKEEASQISQQIGNKTKEIGENAQKMADKAYKSMKTGFNEVYGLFKQKVDQVIGKDKDKQIDQSQQMEINIQTPQQQTIPNVQQQKQQELYQFQDFDAQYQQQQQQLQQQQQQQQQTTKDLIDYEEYFQDGPSSVIIYEQPKQPIQQQQQIQQQKPIQQQQQQQNLIDLFDYEQKNQQTTPNLLDL